MTDASAPPADDNNEDAAALSPTRPDGWPDWLGRRPIPASERDRLRQTIDADRHAYDTARIQAEQQLTPRFPYLIIEGLGQENHPRKRTRLRARITLGIAGPEAHQRIQTLRTVLQQIGRGRRWTITEDAH